MRFCRNVDAEDVVEAFEDSLAADAEAQGEDEAARAEKLDA